MQVTLFFFVFLIPEIPAVPPAPPELSGRRASLHERVSGPTQDSAHDQISTHQHLCLNHHWSRLRHTDAGTFE